MTRVDRRKIRIFASENTPNPQRGGGGGTRDFGALMLAYRSRLHATNGYEYDVAQGVRPVHACLEAPHNHSDRSDGGSEGEQPIQRPQLTDGLPAMVADVVRSLTFRSMAEARRIAQIARTIEQLCSDSSISDGSQWDLEIELDHNVLPQTTLLLRISPFVVHVRFYARHAESKRLISSYRPSLMRRLENLALSCGKSCDVEIEVT